MAVLTGARGTGNILQAQRKVDMADAINLLQPDAAPLTVLSGRLSKRSTVNPEFSWLEDDLRPRFDSSPAGASNVATTVPVADGTKFAPHDLVYVTRTGEIMRVTAVASNNLTVVRGVGSTAATINAADETLIIGSAQPEGDVSKPALSVNANKVSNYTQIFRTPVEMTDTLRKSDQFTQPHDWDYQLKKAGIEHQKDKEFAFLFGHPSEDLSGSQPRRTTGGALNYIVTNQTDAGGTLTETEFFGALRPAFRYGSKTKVAFSSGLSVDVLNTFPRGKVQVTDQGSDSYGIKVVRYVSPHGTLNVVTDWLLEGKFGGYIIVLDLDQIKQRPLANSNGSRDTHLKENIQAPDADTEKAEYLAEVGLQFGLEKTHAVITNVTG